MAKIKIRDTKDVTTKKEDNTARSYTLLITHFINPDCSWSCYGNKHHSNVAWCAGNIKKDIGPFKEGERVNMTVGGIDIFIQGVGTPKAYTFVLGKDIKV